jgi:hypothetical protein
LPILFLHVGRNSLRRRIFPVPDLKLLLHVNGNRAIGVPAVKPPRKEVRLTEVLSGDLGVLSYLGG